ncbi:NAD(P)/FAD-dependent oxidoreductase [Paenibacillus silvae]|uniref:NAD(P)/FAD-dependent oxidoreductase n=1 Tax=Paenibacillus silvae TaxID=1325358 RepID=UPI002004789F|nr:NAD(P)/FAD-dependent oxidoreductase [Paenibacillus silvae]MCK6076684.1 NAD(P)/FAD-dependent oxidoreductase [Paenibacillus silvae]MCK6151111.1 NAD(P)/FAD-dependent oxidoreductase [Paenibacillus silvae]MCK6269370.1 NAD(P)/FAD-dependent oxidoreductase [Paenibacillus silvae]
MKRDIYDVIIIGGGPAGMYAAFYSGMREMRTKIIEAKHELGGFMRTYPEKMVWDVGGIEPVRCESIIHSLITQATTFDPTIVYGQEVVGMDKGDDGIFTLTANTGEKHYTKTIILATGRGITRIQKLTVEGADRYELSNLHYTVTSLNRFKDKRVLISGGGDSAVDWAIEIADLAKEVYVVHRRDDFSAFESSVTRMKSVATTYVPYVVTRLHGQDNQIDYVTLQHVDSQEEIRLDVDEVLVNHGFERNFGGAILNWGLASEEWGITVTPQMCTSIPGIFGAGDIVTNEGKIRLIAGAFNDAVHAVNSAKLYIDPTESKMAGVSSHNDRFAEKNEDLRQKNKSTNGNAVQ